MPNYNQSFRKSAAAIGLGMRVDRPAADCQGAAPIPLFNIKGGRVVMSLILGEVTVAIAAGANNFKLQSNPETGTTTDLCANLDIDADGVGTLYTIAGAAATALQRSEHGGALGQTVDIILPVGAIEAVSAGDVAGSMKWSLFYWPIDDGAYVEAA